MKNVNSLVRDTIIRSESQIIVKDEKPPTLVIDDNVVKNHCDASTSVIHKIARTPVNNKKRVIANLRTKDNTQSVTCADTTVTSVTSVIITVERSGRNDGERRRRRDVPPHQQATPSRRRLRREKIARCVARTTIASRSSVAIGSRKKVRPSRECRSKRPRRAGSATLLTTKRLVKLCRPRIVTPGGLRVNPAQVFGVSLDNETNYEISANAFRKIANFGSSVSYSSDAWSLPRSSNVRKRKKKQPRVIVECCEKSRGDVRDVLNEIFARIERLLDENRDWTTTTTTRTTTDKTNCTKVDDATEMKICETTRNQLEDPEKHDEFNAAMIPVAKILNNIPQSDEGIEPDERRKLSVDGNWSLESANQRENNGTRGYEETDKRKTKQKITRCCSSDSAVLSDDEQVKGRIFLSGFFSGFF